ncbi:kinase-like domain-containing protein [Gigaspora rosea]|uniref:Kinase-like domain-containing protein n=1 Tax=Gigaspora rosea TaxID=44941 RepID=A0A397VM26_9GLOM|nr:kinase-like domain-containing protein [Gigaspora rosea]
MLVFNEFGSKRNDKNGKCANCNRYNTSSAWCQTCDPQKTALGWTSGNKNIDDCIKELQLNATNYEDVIEWIPFNRLDNIQKIGEEFLAVWLDGVRLKQYIKEPTQSRNPSCKEKLKILHESKNLLEVLCKFKDLLVQSKDSSPKFYELSQDSSPKVYGLTQNTSTDEYMLVFDFQRYAHCGKCANCNRYNTNLAWCQSCDPQKTTQEWTSGNKDVDNCIKEFQLKSTSYEDVIDWIPFNRLNNVQKIGEGGFGSVFSATWLDGKRTVSNVAGEFIQSRTPTCIVALKTLPGSQENFLREFKSYTEFRLMGSNLEVYGLTQDTTNNEYLMVFQYANKGSLHTFLLSNFRELNWKSKLNQLFDISQNLTKIHNAGYVHRDFHSGNILQNQYINGNLLSYIADLGLSRKKDESDLEDSIYGVLPYFAPEVLYKRPYTIAADVYSFGIIMTELSTGRPPHYDIKYDEGLAIRICNGLRPEFAKGTPECYIKLANECMDANPSNRPSASNIYDELFRWNNIVRDGVAKDRDELAILKAFQSADAIIPKLSTKLSNCPKDKLTSKLLNFKNLSEPVNSSLSSISASKTIDFVDIPTDL